MSSFYLETVIPWYIKNTLKSRGINNTDFKQLWEHEKCLNKYILFEIAENSSELLNINSRFIRSLFENAN